MPRAPNPANEFLSMIDDPFDLTDDDYGFPTEPEPPAPPAWLEGLNPEQYQAVTTTEGPLLVLSGAGTGKTRVLTTRLANILSQRLAPPWNCLCVTFTNRAAREMRERVAAMIGPVAEQVWLGTFHSLGVRMLRKHGELVGLKPGFLILDTDDQLRLLKPLLEERSLDPKKWPPAMVMSILQRWKDRGWSPETVPEQEARHAVNGHGSDLYRAYQQRLSTVNACDFGDLLLHCLTLFRTHPDVLASYQRQFRYILVDEYQDTNVSQYLWLRALSMEHRNICCVGDDDQSIYSWRGAEVANILRFERDFPGAQTVRLERNYRSTPMILGAASGLIRHNQDRLGKDLRAAGATSDGDKVRITGMWDGQSEARDVIDEIIQQQRLGTSLTQIAILVRAGFQTREFEERFISVGLPYKVVGGLRFYERQEIRDIIAYLRLVEQPADDLAFERIINTPKRGLGDASLQIIHRTARAHGVPLLEATRRALAAEEFKAKTKKTISDFLAQRDEWTSLQTMMSPRELTATVLEQSGYLDMWKKDKAPDAPGRVENLQELLVALEEFDSLTEFLEHIALVMDNDAKANENDSVTVMTLHAAKGLEFDVVFLPGWEEDIFPNRRSVEESGPSALEEERRLAYVGLTRARKRAFISFAGSRRVYNQWQNNAPSRFISEIPEDCRLVTGDVPLTGGRSRGQNDWDRPSDDPDWSLANSGWGRHSTSNTTRSGFSSNFADDAPPPRRPSPSQEGLAWKTQPVKRAAPRKSAAFAVGQRVLHAKFGLGSVSAAEGDKLTVEFDDHGAKKVMAAFVSAAEE